MQRLRERIRVWLVKGLPKWAEAALQPISVANDGGSLPFLIVCAVDYDASDGLGAGRCSDRFYCAWGYVGAARVGPAR